MIHGSNANTSGRRRAGLVYRYMPHVSLFDRSYPDKVNSSGYLVMVAPLVQWSAKTRARTRGGRTAGDVTHHFVGAAVAAGHHDFAAVARPWWLEP